VRAVFLDVVEPELPAGAGVQEGPSQAVDAAGVEPRPVRVEVGPLVPEREIEPGVADGAPVAAQDPRVNVPAAQPQGGDAGIGELGTLGASGPDEYVSADLVVQYPADVVLEEVVDEEVLPVAQTPDPLAGVVPVARSRGGGAASRADGLRARGGPAAGAESTAAPEPGAFAIRGGAAAAGRQRAQRTGQRQGAQADEGRRFT